MLSPGKRKKEPPPPPVPGPYIHKLHLADNGIDMDGVNRQRGLLACVHSLSELVTYSECLLELDLDDNLIGNLGGRELLTALEQREQGEAE